MPSQKLALQPAVRTLRSNATTSRVLLALGLAILAAVTGPHPLDHGLAEAAAANRSLPRLVPEPVSIERREGTFELARSARIVVTGDAAAVPVADILAADLRPATGYPLPVITANARPGDLSLRIEPSASDPTGESYRLAVTSEAVVLRASTPHGLFDGVQTLRQLLPPWIDSAGLEPGPWTIPAVQISDQPRYTYRGYMLDIARHYEAPSVVKRLIDEISAYKIDVLHLHVSDDQGFRIVMNGFPRLTAIGGQGSVGTNGRPMDPGGYWSQADYRSVVAHATAHFITVVPEVDSPGHDNAIIMSEYGDTANPLLDNPQDINCSANNPPVWDYSIDVGYSALCPASRNTWTILTTILNQLTSMSPGPYYDLGGDEVPTTLLTAAEYAGFVNREFGIVHDAGKRVMGWADIAGPGTQPPPGSVAEYWQPADGSSDSTITAREAVAKGMQIVMAPAFHTYLDQKYIAGRQPTVPPKLGMDWACPTGCDVDRAYDWDPGNLVTGVTDSNVIGVEGAMWGETVVNVSNVEYMTFPRLLALAEVGWSPGALRTKTSRAYHDFLRRLAAQGARLLVKGQNFYPSTEVPWRLDAVAAALPVEGDANGLRATVAAPGIPISALSATIEWGDGTSSPAGLTGIDPTPVRVNSLYELVARHRYRERGSHLATLVVRAPGKSPVAVTVVIVTS